MNDITFPKDRELDIQIAREVMKWDIYWNQSIIWVKSLHKYDSCKIPTGSKHLPRFGNNLDEAWEIVDFLLDPEGPYGKNEFQFGMAYARIFWTVKFCPYDLPLKEIETQRSTTQAEAICHAALYAVENWPAKRPITDSLQ